MISQLPNKKNMARTFRIHPAIGVARMGNSPTAYYVGPETPGVPPNWDDATKKFNSFRDDHGRIKRQGARFRVFEYFLDEATQKWGNPMEVKLGAADVVDIQWRVHLANRKASFFAFDGQNGALDNYIERSQIPGNSLIKDELTNLRNATVAPADREAKLEVDVGEKQLSAKDGGEVEMTNPNRDIPIQSLGTLKLDEGRLVVLGGYGQSDTNAKQPDGEPTLPMREYANNDTWFDDASDGPVKARVCLTDGTFIDAEAAWVLVGPPDFAPPIGNVVTLYDTIWDVAVRKPVPIGPFELSGELLTMNRQQAAWAANGGKTLKGYQPSFLKEIYPLLKRALDVRDLHESSLGTKSYHRRSIDYGELFGPNGQSLRETIFQRMRNPDAPKIEWESMPRGNGDNYRSLERLKDREPIEGDPAPNSLFSVTRVQYALLREWAAGNFQNDWTGSEPNPESSLNPLPEQLDKAAVDNSVGGPFYPGIDCSWLIRTPELYSSPLRLKVPAQPLAEISIQPLRVGGIEFRPGFFSQQMALPWQADFYDCQKEKYQTPNGSEFYFMWWAAHRPDDVFPSGQTDQQRWTRLLDSRSAKPDDPDQDDNYDRFSQMLKGWHDLKFVSVHNGSHWEEEP